MNLITKINLPPDLNKIREVVEKLADTVTDKEANTDLHFRINVALTEAISNAIMHGCCEDNDTVTIQYFAENETHSFKIADPGDGPDCEIMRAPQIDDDIFSEHHRGSVIIHWAVDELICQNLENGFELTLNFKSRG